MHWISAVLLCAICVLTTLSGTADALPHSNVQTGRTNGLMDSGTQQRTQQRMRRSGVSWWPTWWRVHKHDYAMTHSRLTYRDLLRHQQPQAHVKHEPSKQGPTQGTGNVRLRGMLHELLGQGSNPKHRVTNTSKSS